MGEYVNERSNDMLQSKKQSVFQKIAMFIEKFKGVGGRV